MCFKFVVGMYTLVRTFWELTKENEFALRFQMETPGILSPYFALWATKGSGRRVPYEANCITIA